MRVLCNYYSAKSMSFFSLKNTLSLKHFQEFDFLPIYMT
jgi:hypothetical protein